MERVACHFGYISSRMIDRETNDSIKEYNLAKANQVANKLFTCERAYLSNVIEIIVV